MNDIDKFKHILEYFVAHLEYVNGSPDPIGRDLLPLSEKFKKTGNGYKGDKIQQQIEEWANFGNDKIAINIQGNYGNYKTKKCYLNWIPTGINIYAEWNTNNKIEKLSIGYYYWWLPKHQPIGLSQRLSDLKLFENIISPALTEFFNCYIKEIKDYNNKSGEFYKQKKLFDDKLKKEKEMEEIEKYKEILTRTHNLILTGAPGTGKTYLAKEIAQQMIFGEIKTQMTEEERKQFNEQCGFVQFHPSYDYTDFVEGLRPIQDDNGNVGFERKDGVFKEFCGRALQNLIDSQKNQAEIKKELSISDKINTFLLDAVDKKNIYNIATGNSFYVRGFTNKHIYVYISENVKVKDLTLSLSDLLALLSSNEKIENGNDIKYFFNRKWRMQHDSYLLVLYNQIKNMKDVDNQSVVSETKKKNFVFIIDEINRGEISKIFGELFFSIDPGYRGEKGRVQTQYQNIVEDGDIFKKGFFVPENVYIIGTMNDIDRSVESMDFAFRRRFAFKEIKADENVGMLDNLAQKDEAINRMKNLNSAIEKIDGLSSAYHIGASYFLKLKDYNGDFNKLWEYHLEGLLREYLRGMSDAETKIADLKKAYENASA